VRQVSPVANNANLVHPTQTRDLRGFRLSGSISSLTTGTAHRAELPADAGGGYFYAYPFDPNGHALQPDQITAFTPAYTKDRYESTAWTLNGSFGDLKAIYAGSYMRRHIEAQQDYFQLCSPWRRTYYDCIGTGAGYFNQTIPQLQGKRCSAMHR